MDNRYYNLDDAIQAAIKIADYPLCKDNAGVWDYQNLLDAIAGEDDTMLQDHDDSYYVVNAGGDIGITHDDGYGVDWLYKTFVPTLKQLREAMGYTQQALADEAKLSLTGYQYFEYGDRSVRRAEARTVLNLAKALGITMEALLGLETDKLC